MSSILDNYCLAEINGSLLRPRATGKLNLYSWFAINLSGCSGQCQPPKPAGYDNGINNMFFCAVPPTWPP